MICDRCGWFIPADCLCRPSAVDAKRMRAEVEARHRASVQLAEKSGWAVDAWVGGQLRRAAA